MAAALAGTIHRLLYEALQQAYFLLFLMMGDPSVIHEMPKDADLVLNVAAE